MLPDWQLPAGVDRGLWDYLRAADMVAGYDAQMAASPLARADVAFCERAFPTPGRLIDLGCGTGRLCVHFAAKGYACVGVDLSEPMLAQARANAAAAGVSVEWKAANLVELGELSGGSFDYAACLFSTLGMVRGAENRAKVVANAFRLLKPGGQFVLHVHNRYFRGLGSGVVWRQRWRTLLGRADAGDVTMPQAYGGAPLTLHHFTRRGAVRLLEAAGFRVVEVAAVGVDGAPARGAYGYLMLAERGRVSAPCDGAVNHV
ncbi:class I SAM-dependent methyltransferase [Urbifossiella limnaea]|uniref:Ubiquinone biosynthesis O-methyltransferase n=1 Tax=Urbifossiella limnaea TaxID=2528023 RepID=A0A517XP87_9BACT|nr:class I SAM-dependent methyltransferase [Urbifossiella limnaea]QDU19308.1 Ubiquinone biosynthesis O-methyltransferase [Urbifossiella limnaea]